MSTDKRIGVFFCGEKFKIDQSEIESLLSYTTKLPNVIFVENLLGKVLAQNEVETLFKKHDINELVIVAESPGYYKEFFFRVTY